MSLVNIQILKGQSPDYIKVVSDGINSAVIETMGFPEDDRYQIIHQLESPCLQYQERGCERIMIHLTMRAGHSNKQAFFMQRQLKPLPRHARD